MVDLYSFDAAGVDETAKKFVMAEDEFVKDGNDLQAYVESMKWDGSAGPAFKTAHKDWTDKYNAVVTVAEDIATKLGKNSSNQQNIEQQNSGTVNYFQM